MVPPAVTVAAPGGRDSGERVCSPRTPQLPAGRPWDPALCGWAPSGHQTPCGRLALGPGWGECPSRALPEARPQPLPGPSLPSRGSGRTAGASCSPPSTTSSSTRSRCSNTPAPPTATTGGSGACTSSRRRTGWTAGTRRHPSGEPPAAAGRRAGDTDTAQVRPGVPRGVTGTSELALIYDKVRRGERREQTDGQADGSADIHRERSRGEKET